MRFGDVRWFMAGLWLASSAMAAEEERVRGFSLTEIGSAIYDAAASPGAPKTDAQKTVDHLYDLGVRHISLTPRGIMTDPHGSVIQPLVPIGERSSERRRYDRLIRYIHNKGMTVGIRPIFFVQKANGEYPYYETLANGTKKLWWHGNIQPRDTRAWFESWGNFLDFYADIAKATKAEEFTLGAELYSMTVGLEDQWQENPYGFPGNWLDLLRKLRTKLGTKVRIMYDINFTDDRVDTPSAAEYGGEFARWRYRLVDLANPSDPAQAQVWQNLVDFWKELDAIGIDMYRSLIQDPDEKLPTQRDELVARLKVAADQYAGQLDTALYQIEGATGTSKRIIFKEIGFKSVQNGFYKPFVFTMNSSSPLNVEHQAVAYEAIFQTFWVPRLEWLGGIVFWDASVDQQLHGPADRGFSPVGKAETESILQKYFTAQ